MSSEIVNLEMSLEIGYAASRKALFVAAIDRSVSHVQTIAPIDTDSLGVSLKLLSLHPPVQPQ